jgi:hypothetical protein
MAGQQWRIRVRGKQRRQVSIDLLVAAVIAFGEQLAVEQREQSGTEGRMVFTYCRCLYCWAVVWCLRLLWWLGLCKHAAGGGRWWHSSFIRPLH